MKRLLLLLPLPLALLARWVASQNTSLVERVFSTSAYPAVSLPISRLVGLIPFSVVEPLLVIFLLFVLYSLFKRRPFRALVAIGLVGAIFFGGFGLNYYRYPLEKTLDLPMLESTTEELAVLCEKLVADANARYTTPPADLLDAAPNALAAAANAWPIPKGPYGSPKYAMISPFLSQLMIAGITSPFTMEPLVNRGIPAFTVPFTASHEMAHVAGFAREEDANLIAYLACEASEEPYYRYSGSTNMLLLCLRALDGVDEARYAAIRALFSPEVEADLQAYSEYWSDFQDKKAAEVGARVNNTYLETIAAGDQGAHSYGRAVDLLLALSRKKGI